MNERIQKLRDLSLNTEETISIERAKLLTEFYSSGEAERLFNSGCSGKSIQILA